MENYQSNSHRSKETPKPPEKKIEKVVVGEVVQKKRGPGKIFRETFFGGEAKIAAGFVAGEVILPALRNLLFDMVTKGASSYIFGESRARTARPPSFGTRVQYNNPIYRPDPRDSVVSAFSRPVNVPGQGPLRQQTKQYQDIILASREDADTVLETLGAVIDQYDFATLGDLYELIGLEAGHTDQKWGWSGLHNASVRQVREGYQIELPPLEGID